MTSPIGPEVVVFFGLNDDGLAVAIDELPNGFSVHVPTYDFTTAKTFVSKASVSLPMSP